MSTVTISKTQYEALTKQAQAYRAIVSATGRDIFTPPPTKNSTTVLSALRRTKKYSEPFLKSVEAGLARSKHFSR